MNKLLESIDIELMFEAPSDDIITKLQGLGYTEFKKDSGVTASVYVPAAERTSTIKRIVAELPGATYNPSMAGSSLGGIEYDGGKIRIRPKGKTGMASAGLGNEAALMSALNSYLEQGITEFEFVGGNGRMFVIQDVVAVHDTGRKVNKRSKSDVEIEDAKGKRHPISIKMASAAAWESADSYYGKNVPSIVSKLVSMKKLEVLDTGLTNNAGAPINKLSKEIAKRATTAEATDVVFGNDMLGNGPVVIQTFTDADFKIVNNAVRISCKYVIFKVADIPEDHYPYFLIRNDKTRRNPKDGMPGVRVLAVTASRALQGSNRVVIQS